ncbi:hypothetical protein LWM68_32080 [Niabella sp. W65]|nr:hypothetical protein [Niabella sp. W65]MCH7366999.1 hypothetical protein [Niabella sp. W65]
MNIFKPLLITCLLFCSQIVSAQLRAKEGKGYFNITNIAEPQYLQSVDSSELAFGNAYIKTVGFSASTINGVFLNPNLSIGLGVGIQFTRYKAHRNATTPDSTFAPGISGMAIA